jgi:hypothetical protein
MDNAMIGKIEKAKRYASERERFSFESFKVTVKGENSNHLVQYEHGKFDCDCSFFQSRNYCSHSMAMERLLDQMIVSPAAAE